jgi:hypothetical protein
VSLTELVGVPGVPALGLKLAVGSLGMAFETELGQAPSWVALGKIHV